jgi:hypothetical protein
MRVPLRHLSLRDVVFLLSKEWWKIQFPHLREVVVVFPRLVTSGVVVYLMEEMMQWYQEWVVVVGGVDKSERLADKWLDHWY